MTDEIVQKIARLGVVPVIAIEEVEKALPLADALLEGGLPIAEITFRTEAAARAIETIAKARPELLIGAGTVLDSATFRRARDAGARFALAPGLSTELFVEARRQRFPFLPGVMTPSEVQSAVAAGAREMKFFPAGPAGGPAMLDAISAPYAHFGVRFNPTGGVRPDNLAEWLALDAVFAAGGTWIASKADLREGRFEAIRDKAREAAAIAAASSSRAAG